VPLRATFSDDMNGAIGEWKGKTATVQMTGLEARLVPLPASMAALAQPGQKLTLEVCYSSNHPVLVLEATIQTIADRPGYKKLFLTLSDQGTHGWIGWYRLVEAARKRAGK